MATKIEDFLKDKKIDPRRVLAASAELERLRPEDRAIRLAKRQARKSEDGGKKKEGIAAQKPRSGRPVTGETLQAAFLGKRLSGPAKNRVLRAVNRLLVQKKLEEVSLSALFEMPVKGKPAAGEEEAAAG